MARAYVGADVLTYYLRRNYPGTFLPEERSESAFWRRTQERIMNDYGPTLVINRCPRCRRIVVSPQARQCLWCHHDWHEAGR